MQVVATEQTILAVGGGSSGRSAALEAAAGELMAVADGATPKAAGLDGHVIQPRKLQDIAVKVVSRG